MSATPVATPSPGPPPTRPTTRTITFTPTASLAAGTVYTATVSGATALSGNLMSPYTWSFTTAGAAACPCTPVREQRGSRRPRTPATAEPSSWACRSRPSVDGYVTGVRFYKSALNTGTHVGSLWSSTGTRLATGTFTGETASGWQTLTFAKPVQLTAGTTYVVSYYAPSGHYAATGQFFSSAYTNGPLTAGTGNGLYSYAGSSSFPTGSYGASNYWVDSSSRRARCRTPTPRR